MNVIGKSWTLLSVIAAYASVVYSDYRPMTENIVALNDAAPMELLAVIDPDQLLQEEALENNESNIIIAQSSDYPKEIEAMLDATPFGSEIYMEEKSSGEVYLRIEFTVPPHEESAESAEPISEELLESIPIEETMII